MTTKRKIHEPSAEKWYHRIWLPVCSFTYIGISIFDFVAMPVVTSIHNNIIEERLVSEAKNNPALQTAFADAYEKASTLKQWQPLTLQGGGLFHLSFGALLAAGATTRGLTKKSEMEGYYSSINGANVDPSSIPPPPKP
jgi:hypothetical protein